MLHEWSDAQDSWEVRVTGFQSRSVHIAFVLVGNSLKGAWLLECPPGQRTFVRVYMLLPLVVNPLRWAVVAMVLTSRSSRQDFVAVMFPGWLQQHLFAQRYVGISYQENKDVFFFF